MNDLGIKIGNILYPQSVMQRPPGLLYNGITNKWIKDDERAEKFYSCIKEVFPEYERINGPVGVVEDVHGRRAVEAGSLKLDIDIDKSMDMLKEYLTNIKKEGKKLFIYMIWLQPVPHNIEDVFDPETRMFRSGKTFDDIVFRDRYIFRGGSY